VSEESASLSQNASSCDVYCGILQANGRRGWTPQYAHYRETTPMWKLYMIPEFGSGMDPDPAGFRVVGSDPDPAGSENCGSGAPLTTTRCKITATRTCSYFATCCSYAIRSQRPVTLSSPWWSAGGSLLQTRRQLNILRDRKAARHWIFDCINTRHFQKPAQGIFMFIFIQHTTVPQSACSGPCTLQWLSPYYK